MLLYSNLRILIHVAGDFGVVLLSFFLPGSGIDVFMLMQGLRGFASQADKPTGKQIKVLLFSVDLVRMYLLCGMLGYCAFDDHPVVIYY
jgi:hypothetical protein